MELEYREVSQQFQISFHMKDRDMYRADFDMRMAIDMDKIKAGAMNASEPAVAAMKLVYADTGYYKLRNAFCAEQSNSTEAAYIDANIAQIGAELGGELPKTVADEYRKFMTNGGTVEINLSPAEATALSGMEFYETADAMRILGMTIAVNGVRFDADQIQWKTAEGKSDTKNRAHQNTLQSRAQHLPISTHNNVPTTAPQESDQPQSQIIKVSQLSRHVGEMVQINTNKGKRRMGVLESVDDERVRIMMKMGVGEYSFPVKIEEITSARLYR
jgi:hypothetical protein